MATITQIQALNLAIAFISENGGDTAVIEKLSAMVTTLENKKSAPSKADRERAEQNDTICEQIINVLTAENRLMTIKEIQTNCEQLSDLSNQKMSAMLKKLVDNGKVVKAIDKKVVYFAIA